MKYFVKTPWWLKRLFPRRVWSIDTKEKVVYLTFDDGPHPGITPFVLDLLKQYQARATFFCIGKNVAAHSAIYQRILNEGHAVGNHTHNHLNGWDTDTEVYINNTAQAALHIHSSLFRPPYGRLRSAQAKRLNHYKLVMWDVLSGDFDTGISGEQCLANVVKNVSPGSVVVFHDSEKAFPRLQVALPATLNTLQQQGYRFDKMEQE